MDLWNSGQLIPHLGVGSEYQELGRIIFAGGFYWRTIASPVIELREISRYSRKILLKTLRFNPLFT